MSKSDIVGIYIQGDLPGSQLQAAIDEALVALAVDEDALADLKLTAEDLKGIRFEVEEEAGIDPATILMAIVLGVAGNAAYDASKLVARKVWSRVLTAVKARHGHGALGDEQPKNG